MASAAPTTAGGAAAPASSTTATKTSGDLDDIIITGVSTRDVRFPTKDYIGDAMNPDPDYSAAYVVLTTNVKGLEGHGLTFTIGRGTEICIKAVESLAYLVKGHNLGEFTANMGKFWKHIVGDSQLRWVGPEKGAIHLATGAIVNAVWDLWAKAVGKPVWKLVADMSPEEIVKLIDFKYITDAITPAQALELLTERAKDKASREKDILENGLPAYTTSAGWLGYDDDLMRKKCQEAIDSGMTHVKMKVGGDLQEDIRRCRIAREVLGPDRHMMVDANQIWDVEEAIEWMKHLLPYDPWWIEEPTSPDDILGHARIRRELGIGVATGEMCQNRVMFKQLLQAEAIDFCQIDSCRLGGVNEVLAVMLMAAKFGVPVCPHAGGVGLCEYVQHLSIINYICISGTLKNTVTEFVDHLHEHFEDPVVVKDGHYIAPSKPGYSITMKPASLDAFTYPDGSEWVKELAARKAADAAAGSS